jgi:hypothetical protein
MKSFREQMRSVVEIGSLPIRAAHMSDREDGTPPLTIGMIVPLFWNGHTTKCGALRSRLRATGRH